MPNRVESPIAPPPACEPASGVVLSPVSLFASGAALPPTAPGFPRGDVASIEPSVELSLTSGSARGVMLSAPGLPNRVESPIAPPPACEPASGDMLPPASRPVRGVELPVELPVASLLVSSGSVNRVEPPLEPLPASRSSSGVRPPRRFFSLAIGYSRLLRTQTATPTAKIAAGTTPKNITLIVVTDF